MPEQITLINGNNRPYSMGLPELHILGHLNSAGLAHIEENTQLAFRPSCGGFSCKPEHAWQIAALLMTYNFKTRYYNNADFHNTLMLKNDHHIGFDVDSICAACGKHNNIPWHGMSPEDRLAC